LFFHNLYLKTIPVENIVKIFINIIKRKNEKIYKKTNEKNEKV